MWLGDILSSMIMPIISNIHIVGISRNSFDIMNVTKREFANVKKNGENYRIVDYKEKKAYDFELVKGE